MKRILSALMFLCLLYSCKKGDVGPAGEEGVAGPQGPQGPQGIAGNANVMQYNYGPQNLSANNFVALNVTTTLDTMNNSGWFVYLYYQSLDRWYAVPGGGVSGTSTYRASYGYAAGKVSVYIDKSGPGELYAKAKVIRIYASGQANGGRVTGLPQLDFKDYNAVRDYYGLED